MSTNLSCNGQGTGTSLDPYIKSFEDSLTKRQYARGTIRTCVCSSFWDVATKEAHHPGAADHQAGHRTGKRQRVLGQRGSGLCCAEVRRAPYRHRSCQFADQFRHRLRPQLRSETDVVPSRVPGVSAASHIFSRLLAIRGRRRDRPDICLRNQWDVTLFERHNVP